MWVVHPGTGDDCYVFEIGISIAVAPTTGPMWRLAKTTALGTVTGSVTPVLEDGGSNAANSRLDQTWSANPTAGTQASNVDLRRYTPTNAIGNGIVWTWYDKGLYVPAGGGLALINGNAAGTTLGSFHVYVRLDE